MTRDADIEALECALFEAIADKGKCYAGNYCPSALESSNPLYAPNCKCAESARSILNVWRAHGELTPVKADDSTDRTHAIRKEEDTKG